MVFARIFKFCFLKPDTGQVDDDVVADAISENCENTGINKQMSKFHPLLKIFKNFYKNLVFGYRYKNKACGDAKEQDNPSQMDNYLSRVAKLKS